MACRTLLSKLEQRGHIVLPKQRTPGRGCRKIPIPDIPHRTAPIACSLSDLEPVSIQLVEDAGLLGLFQCLLARYHYLGFRSTVGENIKYLVFDREQNPLACLLFGSAAWKCDRCGGQVNGYPNTFDEHVIEDMEIKKRVTCYRFHYGYCKRCQKVVRAKAKGLGNPNDRIGVQARAVVSYLRYLGLTYGKAAQGHLGGQRPVVLQAIAALHT